MEVYAHVSDIYLSSSTSLLVSVRFSFDNSGIVNDVQPLSVTPPTGVTSLLLNQAIGDALASYINATYGLSITRSNIIIVGGATLYSIL